MRVAAELSSRAPVQVFENLGEQAVGLFLRGEYLFVQFLFAGKVDKVHGHDDK
jgi:hypothetical protein